MGHIKAKPLYLVLLPMILLSLLFAAPVNASTNGGMAGIGMSVKAVIPENQLDKNKTYFDLRMSPGQTQVIEMILENPEPTDVTMSVDVITASTNASGTIDYKTKGQQDKTLKYAISDLCKLDETMITLAPGETKTLKATITMPPEQFDGVLLGGFAFTRHDPEQDPQPEQGVVVKNIFSYVLGIVLSETDTPITPDLEAVAAIPDLVNHRSAIVHEIRNNSPMIVKNVSMNLTIENTATKETIWQENKDYIEFAPNSLMKYPLYFSDKPMEPGDYVSHITLQREGKTWTFDLPFSVASDKAATINDGVLIKPYAENVIPAWVTFAIAGLSTLLVVLLVLFIIVLRKKKS